MGPQKSNRSVVHDEIGDRLRQGRKTANRPTIRTPPNTSIEMKRKALERAKQLVIHRHFTEVQRIFDQEIKFLVELYIWAGQPQDFNADVVADLTEKYYAAHPVSEEHTLKDQAIEEPMFTTDGREIFHGRPRPRRRHSNTEQILEKS